MKDHANLAPAGKDFPTRIMAVDDDPFVRTVIHDVLTANGATVKAFASGAAALTAATEFQPDLVLLDVRMQGMDGAQTANALREKMTRPQIIFLTAENDARAREVMGFAAAGIIRKPFDPMTLVDSIQHVLSITPRVSRTARFDGIASDFRRSLSDTVKSIERSWTQLRSGSWQKDAAEAILAKAHMLAGSAGLFHEHSIGRAADQLEGTLRDLLKANVAPNVTRLARLEADICALTRACRGAMT